MLYWNTFTRIITYSRSNNTLTHLISVSSHYHNQKFNAECLFKNKLASQLVIWGIFSIFPSTKCLLVLCLQAKRFELFLFLLYTQFHSSCCKICRFILWILYTYLSTCFKNKGKNLRKLCCFMRYTCRLQKAGKNVYTKTCFKTMANGAHSQTLNWTKQSKAFSFVNT